LQNFSQTLHTAEHVQACCIVKIICNLAKNTSAIRGRIFFGFYVDYVLSIWIVNYHRGKING